MAHLLRLNLLAEGYIYPKEERAVRDLLRKRSQLVRFKTTNILSAQNILSRQSGQILKANDIMKIVPGDLPYMLKNEDTIMALESNLMIDPYTEGTNKAGGKADSSTDPIKTRV